MVVLQQQMQKALLNRDIQQTSVESGAVLGTGAASVPSANAPAGSSFPGTSLDVSAIQALVNKNIKLMCSEDKIRSITRASLQDIKFQFKKLKEDQRYMIEKYDRVKMRLRDQNRLLEKIRYNSQRSHGSRSASKHREKEYITTRKFGAFITFLLQTLEALIKNDEQALRRQARLAELVVQAQYHSAGSVLCKPEVNHACKRTRDELRNTTVTKPDLQYLIFDDEQLPRLEEYVDPKVIAMRLSKYGSHRAQSQRSYRSERGISVDSRRTSRHRSATRNSRSRDRARSQSKRSNSVKKLQRVRSGKSTRS